jgi:hypothetical protein
MISHLNRWNQFKLKKGVVIDKFIQVKRKQRAMISLIAQAKTIVILKHLSSKFQEAVFEQEKMFKSRIVSMIVKRKWR